ncbi:hypothetical protein BDK51DRAFT_45853 [Blyttiomyces helicus]|uniref:Uncharacterized protein n=1 Tax=Blyttiomyces helicus TaxID=388810 RepID=A0A4V1IQT4_9FUNG|nr:hypothetical protein BDK51DRAFT_45853 [Blyttiomyces helicus]|eukprot:RKO87667.1 hypothetical protein BDK51DRAFT_45853 [Blyttiomyces helicus]
MAGVFLDWRVPGLRRSRAGSRQALFNFFALPTLITSPPLFYGPPPSLQRHLWTELCRENCPSGRITQLGGTGSDRTGGRRRPGEEGREDPRCRPPKALRQRVAGWHAYGNGRGALRTRQMRRHESCQACQNMFADTRQASAFFPVLRNLAKVCVEYRKQFQVAVSFLGAGPQGSPDIPAEREIVEELKRKLKEAEEGHEALAREIAAKDLITLLDYNYNEGARNQLENATPAADYASAPSAQLAVPPMCTPYPHPHLLPEAPSPAASSSHHPPQGACLHNGSRVCGRRILSYNASADGAGGAAALLKVGNCADAGGAAHEPLGCYDWSSGHSPGMQRSAWENINRPPSCRHESELAASGSRSPRGARHSPVQSTSNLPPMSREEAFGSATGPDSRPSFPPFTFRPDPPPPAPPPLHSGNLSPDSDPICRPAPKQL